MHQGGGETRGWFGGCWHSHNIQKIPKQEFHALNHGAAILLRLGFIIGSVRNPSHLTRSCQDASAASAPLPPGCFTSRIRGYFGLFLFVCLVGFCSSPMVSLLLPKTGPSGTAAVGESKGLLLLAIPCGTTHHPASWFLSPFCVLCEKVTLARPTGEAARVTRRLRCTGGAAGQVGFVLSAAEAWDAQQFWRGKKHI